MKILIYTVFAFSLEAAQKTFGMRSRTRFPSDSEATLDKVLPVDKKTEKSSQ